MAEGQTVESKVVVEEIQNTKSLDVNEISETNDGEVPVKEIVTLHAIKKIKYKDLEIEFGTMIDTSTEIGKKEHELYEKLIDYLIEELRPAPVPPERTIAVLFNIGSSQVLSCTSQDSYSMQFVNLPATDSSLNTIWYLRSTARINTYLICTHDQQYHWTFRNMGRNTGEVILQQLYPGDDSVTQNLFYIDLGGVNGVYPFQDTRQVVYDLNIGVYQNFSALQSSRQNRVPRNGTILTVTGN